MVVVVVVVVRGVANEKMVFPSFSLQANFHSNGGHHQHYCSSLSGSFVLGRHHHRHHHQADGRQSYPCPFGCCCLLCSPLDSTTCCCCRHTGQTRSPITCIAPFLCDSKCSIGVIERVSECVSLSLSQLAPRVMVVVVVDTSHCVW